MLFMLGGALRAQNVPMRHYDKPLWTSRDGFTYPASARELKDGRLLVTEIKDIEIWLLSATGDRIRQIGRRGAGPQEFQLPLRALAMPGDSTLIVDRSQRRFMLIDADAKPVKTIMPPVTVSAGVETAKTVDQRGRVYFSDAGTAPDSTPRVPLLRWDRAADRVDTVATLTLQQAEKQPHIVDGGNTIIRYYSPFPSEDGWVALNDGTVMVLRAADYHADIISPSGAIRKATPIPFARVPVTAAERKEYSPRILPDVKPAFSAYDMFATSDGEVWVRHYRAADAAVTRWDILNAQGVRIAMTDIPKTRTLLAVTRSKVYLYRTDDDGLKWIEAYAR
jgi:hypothetical protein